MRARTAGFAAAAILVATIASAQTNEGNRPSDEREREEAVAKALSIAPLPADTQWRASLTCTLLRPSEVQRYNVRCTGATRLDVQMADCCIAGDHWEGKSKNWDSRPNTAVTTSPGPANVFGVASRVYNYGGAPQNPRNIDAEVDCSYIHGVDVFPAASFIILSSDGVCRVTDLGKRDAINRTP